MTKELVTGELWEVIELLLPEEPPKPEGGRPRIDNRAALTGILFVLMSGIPWKMLPQEMGCGIESSEKLGKYQRVERTLSWINRFRRLRMRYERRDDVHQAFLDLGCALICWRYVQRLC